MKIRLEICLVLAMLISSLHLYAEEPIFDYYSAISSEQETVKRSSWHWGVGLSGGILEGVGYQASVYPTKGLDVSIGSGYRSDKDQNVRNSVALGSRYFFSPDSSFSLNGFGKVVYLKSHEEEVKTYGPAPSLAEEFAAALVGAKAKSAVVDIKKIKLPGAVMFGLGPGIQYMHSNGFTVNLDVGGGVVLSGSDYWGNFMPQAGLSLAWTF
jgi:hypothetical protein